MVAAVVAGITEAGERLRQTKEHRGSAASTTLIEDSHGTRARAFDCHGGADAARQIARD
jgi:hypothetical protein